jgi:hypothetical protein
MEETKFSVGFEVFTAVTIKISVIWDIKTQLIPHRRHIISLQNRLGLVRTDVLEEYIISIFRVKGH